MINIQQNLLDMDIERFFVCSMFLAAMSVFLKILLHFFKARQKPVRYAAGAVILSLTVSAGIEALTRIYYFIKDGEPYVLIYPFRAYTTNYLNLDYTPRYYTNTDGSLSDATTTVQRVYNGLTYFNITQNNKGFRFEPEKYSHAKYNILALGGSVTWGQSSNGLTYPDLLQKELGDKVAVYNLGKPGHGTRGVIDNINKSAILGRVRADMAILYCCTNDSNSQQFLFEGQDRFGGVFGYRVGKYPLIKYSFVARTVSLILSAPTAEKIVGERLKEEVKVDKAYLSESEKAFKNNLVKIITFLKEHNPDIAILLVPEFTNFYVPITEFVKSEVNIDQPVLPAYQYINYDLLLKHEVMKDLSKQKNVAFVGIDFFAKHPTRKLLMDAVHLTAFGNKVLAENLRAVAQPLMMR